MDEPRHVPAPWQYSRHNWRNEETDHDWHISGDPAQMTAVAVCIVPGNPTSHPVCEATARRICAAVNACEGMPVESLESFGTGGLTKSRELLLAACQAMGTHMFGLVEDEDQAAAEGEWFHRLYVQWKAAMAATKGTSE